MTARVMRYGWLVAVLAAFTVWAADVAVPQLTARVTDLTGTLTGDQRASLEQKLAAFEASKGSQIAVLIVPTTAPEAIEQYSIRVVEQWKLGRKGVDDGALLLVAKNDRTMRIEVGYGLEGALPDAIAKRIVAETITPYFKAGDFYGGISAGVDQMMKVIQGEPLPPPARQTSAKRGADWGSTLPVVLFGALFLGGVMRNLLGRFMGAAATGGIAGAVVWMLFSAMGVALVAGVMAFIFALMTGGRGFGGGFGGWGGGGGGWSSGGGFGGGGGGFGGGGASGRW